MCLQSIHNDQANLREYDCVNMVNCYVCSYINKYASEIFYAFQSLVNHPSTRKDEYNILSIGCGDCADLFGIDEFLRRNARNPSISYTGVDKNGNWRETHEKVKSIFPDVSFDFEYEDIFDFVDSLDEIPYNIVVLEYVLNEIRKYTPDDIDDFIDKLAHNIIDRLPNGSLIIINDINHNMVRDYYPKLRREAIVNNTINHVYLRFRTPLSHTYGGVTLPNDGLVFNTQVNPIFDEKSPCSSCIYLLFKQ